MEVKKTVKSQYYASLEMLRQVILGCPETLWNSIDYKAPFWQIAYHVLFYTHFYLQTTEDDFVPWKKHREELISLGPSDQELESVEPYSKEEILAYHKLCCEQVEDQVTSLDLETKSGFYWLPFNKFELQIYNIRHIQQHTGELFERLGASADIELDWVGMKPD